MSVDNNMMTIEHLKETISITKVGVFIWNLETDHVIYSKEWAEIVGYEQEELEPHVATWESMLYPSDLAIAEKNINKYLDGEVPLYEAEFRMIKKDGTVIWGHDKGKVTKYTEDGKPLILCGVLQDITNIKLTEQLLRESTDILNLAIEVAEFGTWDWDLEKDIISYNDEYLKMLGYTQDEIVGSLAEWEAMNHPEDLILVTQLLDEFVAGTRPNYECEIRMLHKDGHYIWTKDVGRIVSKNENGIATRVIGGHLNIDSLKNSQSQLEKTLNELEKTLNELENHQTHLENEIEMRTKTLIVQDQLLMAVNTVSQQLLAVNEAENFDSVLIDCLKTLTIAFNTSEFTLWRYLKIEEYEFFYLTHLYRKDIDEKIIYDVSDIQEYITNLLISGNDFQIHTREDNNIIINYSKVPLELRKNFEIDKSINDFLTGMSENWQENVLTQIENSQSSIAASIYLYNTLFGIIATGSDSKEFKYSEAHESMLDISGKLFANAQKKHEMDAQLRYAHEEALLSSQAKTNFLANMSHEIRTPLNAILGMSEIVLRESKGRTTEDYATEIKKASESLLLIINDILDISKIESGKLEIINVEYNMASLLSDIISISKMRLEDKPVILTTFIQSDIPSVFFGDEIRIKQVLLNLISNAIKFTKEGNINLRITCEKQGEIAELVFSVADTGIGIKEEDMQRLFLQFERVDTKKNRNIEGTGLGLAITKQLCEMMNGTVSVQSQEGVGSVFTAKIPQLYKESMPIANSVSEIKILVYEAREIYAHSLINTLNDMKANCRICTNQSELTQCLLEQTFDYIIIPVVYRDKIKNHCQTMNITAKLVFTTDPGDLTIYSEENVLSLPINCMQLSQIFGNHGSLIRKEEKIYSFIAPDAKILVVDDNRINLEVAKGLMKPFELNLETAINGAIAVDMVAKNTYDLVFMDHMMPEMDGIDATTAIRKMDGDYYKNLPIIALTANALVGAKELFVKEGMNDFLAKPIEVEKLNDILQTWLPKEKQQAIIAHKKYANDYNIQIEGIDTNYGINIIGGEINDYYDVLSAFYIDGLKKIEKLNVDITEENLAMYRIEIHALKSASASIGAKELSQEAKNLEEAAIKHDFTYITMNSKYFILQFQKLLNTINTHLEQKNKENQQGKTQGVLSSLEKQLQAIKNALDTYDIEILEKTIQESLSYSWEAEIDELLLKLKQNIDSFEYQQASDIVEEIMSKMGS